MSSAIKSQAKLPVSRRASASILMPVSFWGRGDSVTDRKLNVVVSEVIGKYLPRFLLAQFLLIGDDDLHDGIHDGTPDSYDISHNLYKVVGKMISEHSSFLVCGYLCELLELLTLEPMLILFEVEKAISNEIQ